MTEDAPVNERFDDAPTVSAILEILRDYLRVILATVAGVVLVTFLVTMVMYVRAPKEQLASTGFRLTFDGVLEDRFANGLRFSVAEVVSTTVLSEVYAANDLQQYGSLEDFKEAMFVLQSNPELDLLSMEYQSKLGDLKLTAVDRARLEEEFRQKRLALKSPNYALHFRRLVGRFRVPSPLVNKAMLDTLSTWARHADQRKGAIRYDVPILSKNVLKKDFWTSEDFIVAADILRNTAAHILGSIEKITALPGAGATRIGDEQRSLEDVRTNLTDLVRFKIEPLIGVIRATGVSRNVMGTDLYFASRGFEVQLARDEANSRIKTLQEALRGYQLRASEDGSGRVEGRAGAVTPQISESFIDRLVTLADESKDAIFRQDLTRRIINEGIAVANLNRQADYYDALRKGFAATRRARNPEVEADVLRRIADIFGDLEKSMDHVQAIYKQIAEQTLNPDTVMYSITSPYAEHTISSMPIRSAAVNVVIAFVAAIILAPLLALLHAYFRRIFRANHPPAGGSAAGASA